jgi:hypothetical protein
MHTGTGSLVDNDPNGHTLVQSDFLNRGTGDTLSFMQLHNYPLESALHGLPLGRPTTVTRDFAAYTIKKPYPLTVLTWRKDYAEYALASTSLDAKDLEKLATEAN